MKRRIIKMIVCLVMVASMIVMPVSASASSIAKIMKVNTNANLRDPSDYEHILTYMKKGTKVLWTGKTKNAFLLVTTTGGQTGYVYRDYLSEYGAVNLSQVYKTKTATKIYKKPSTSAHVVEKVGSGRFVLVYATSSGWAYVKTTSGKGGYMKTSTLKKYK